MNMRRDSSSPPAPQNDRLNNPHQSPFRKVGSAQLAIKLFLLYLYKRLVRVHGVSYLDEYLHNNAVYGRVDLVLHLHGLDCKDRISFRNLGSHGYLYRGDLAGDGRRNVAFLLCLGPDGLCYRRPLYFSGGRRYDLCKRLYHNLFKPAVDGYEKRPLALYLVTCPGDLYLVGLAVDRNVELAGREVEDSMRGLVLRFLFERLGLELAGVPLHEELHGHYREEGIREHVIYGFCLAVYVPHHLVELRLKQVSRPAGDSLLVAYGELSRGLVYGAGRLAVEPLEVVPGLARYYLVSLAHEHVERRLRAHDLARGSDERRITHVLPDPGYLVEDLVHLIEGVLFPQLIFEVRYHASGYLDDQRLGVDGRVLALEPLVLLPYLPEPVGYLGEQSQVKAR